jgi:hypothetical protein
LGFLLLFFKPESFLFLFFRSLDLFEGFRYVSSSRGSILPFTCSLPTWVESLIGTSSYLEGGFAFVGHSAFLFLALGFVSG